MDIKDCFAGQRVLYKENGKVATVKDVLLHKNQVQLIFDNAAQTTVPPRFLQPITGRADDAAAEDSKPATLTNPCPSCAAPIPVGSARCSACGFAYKRKGSSLGSLVKLIVILVLLAGIAYAVWKYVLREKLPF